MPKRTEADAHADECVIALLNALPEPGCRLAASLLWKGLKFVRPTNQTGDEWYEWLVTNLREYGYKEK